MDHPRFLKRLFQKYRILSYISQSRLHGNIETNRTIVVVFCEPKNSSWKVRSSLPVYSPTPDRAFFQISTAFIKMTSVLDERTIKFVLPMNGSFRNWNWNVTKVRRYLRSIICFLRSSALPLVLADSGLMGGSINHEFLAVSPAGEDTIQICSKWGQSSIVIVFTVKFTDATRDHWKIEVNANMQRKWITKRSNWAIVSFWVIDTPKSFMVTNHRPTQPRTRSNDRRCMPIFTVERLSPFRPLVMGCYGIGVTRLMAAAVEILTPRDSTTIHWPRRIVPYQVAVIPPKVSFWRVRETVPSSPL